MIDVNRLCSGCMELKADAAGPCPNCGYRPPEAVKGDQALPPFSILAGRYLLGAAIGTGGFGIIYIALDLVDQTKVAVKEFFPAMIARREGLLVMAAEAEAGRYFREAYAGFQKESGLLFQLRGIKSVVSWKNFIEENGTGYLVMEYVPGLTLKQYMRQTRKLFSQSQIMELMRPILLAVGHMHQNGILHRDVSPENLILKPDGTLILIDFGAARKYSLSQEEKLTVILKHGYAPEEQYHYGSHQGLWTDIYACCAVMYQMASGILPQDASDRNKKDLLLPLDEVEGTAVTKAFARIIEKGMTVAAVERYPSVQALLKDLEQAARAVQAVQTVDAGPAPDGGAPAGGARPYADAGQAGGAPQYAPADAARANAALRYADAASAAAGQDNGAPQYTPADAAQFHEAPRYADAASAAVGQDNGAPQYTPADAGQDNGAPPYMPADAAQVHEAPQYTSAEAVKTDGTPGKKRRRLGVWAGVLGAAVAVACAVIFVLLPLLEKAGSSDDYEAASFIFDDLREDGTLWQLCGYEKYTGDMQEDGSRQWELDDQISLEYEFPEDGRCIENVVDAFGDGRSDELITIYNKDGSYSYRSYYFGTSEYQMDGGQYSKIFYNNEGQIQEEVSGEVKDGIFVSAVFKAYEEGQVATKQRMTTDIHADGSYTMESKVINDPEGQETVQVLYRYEYDEDGKVLRRATEHYAQKFSLVESYTYDSYGNILSYRREHTYEGEDGIEEDSTTTYTYDSQGNLQTMVEGRGDDPTITEFTYDSYGNILTVLEYSQNGSISPKYINYFYKEYAHTKGISFNPTGHTSGTTEASLPEITDRNFR